MIGLQALAPANEVPAVTRAAGHSWHGLIAAAAAAEESADEGIGLPACTRLGDSARLVARLQVPDARQFVDPFNIVCPIDAAPDGV